jgi:glycerophosphoryl diester phosphodiesterase
VRAVRDNGLADRAIVSSFNPLAVRRVRQLDAGISTGLLYGPGLLLLLRRSWLRYLVRPGALHPHHSLVDAAYMRWARKRGCRVNVWTADDPGEMQRLIRLGVDLIITNRPDLLRRALNIEAVSRGE